MKVYVVGVGCYTGLAVVKIFDSKEKAQEFAGFDYYDVVEMEVE